MRRSGHIKFIVVVAILGLHVFLADSARSAGFAIIEQGVKGLGNAYAGGSAAAEDATTIFFNPAGLTRLTSPQLEVAAHVILLSAEFDNKNSTVSPSIPVFGGTPLTGGEGGEAGKTGLIPNIYYARNLTDKLFGGVGINVPFGLETSYSDGWVGRYHALDSKVITININPTIAYKIDHRFSVGAGFNIQYIDAELSNAVDFGLLGFIGGVPGFTPQGQDGQVKLAADDWGYGFNLGVLFEPTDMTRIGVAYRSKISYTLEGDADFRYPNPAAAALASAPTLNLIDQDAEASIDLPDTFSVSGYHQLNENWAIMGDITWTNWSRLDEIRIEFDQGAADNVTTLEWDDSFRYAVGVTYTDSTPWTFRGGLAFDETPTPSASRRTPRIPGADRFWVAFGTTYRFSDRLGIDFAYAHLFIDDAEIRKTGTEPEDLTRGALNGEYDASVDIISFQISWIF